MELLHNKKQQLQFSFFNIKKEIKKKSLLRNVISTICLFQLGFVVLNVLSFYSVASEYEGRFFKIYEDHAILQKAGDDGDDKKFLYEYAKLKNQPFAISDFLSSGVVLNLDRRYSKLQKSTKESVLYIYNNGWNSGYKAENDTMTRLTTCRNMVDLSCFLLSPITDSIKYSYKNVYNKVKMDNYNIQHPQEYNAWRTKNQINGDGNPRSPGHIVLIESDAHLKSSGHIAFEDSYTN